MTLGDKLRDFNGRVIRVAAKDGSSFVFVDEIDANTPKVFDQLTEDWKKWINKKYRKYETLLKNHDTRFAALLSSKNLKSEEYAEAKARHKQKTINNVERMRKLKDEFKPFLEREVVEVYPSCYNDDLIVVVTGYESGSYWFRSEFQEYKFKKGAGR